MATEVPGQLLITLRFSNRAAAIRVPRGPRRRRHERVQRVDWKEFDRVLAEIRARSVTRVHQPFPVWALKHERWGRSRRLMDCTFLVTYDHQRTTSKAALQAFLNWKAVEKAGPNRFLRALTPPAGGTAHPWFDSIGMVDVWSVTRGSPQVTIAVIDSGIDRNHPEFPAAKLRVQDGCDVVDVTDVEPPFGEWAGDDAGRDNDPTDDFGHGTYISGLVAGSSHGVAPGCSILPVRALATAVSQVTGERDVFGKADDLARAIRFAVDHGARILNLSFGNVEAQQNSGNAVERHAIEDAVNHGCFLAAAMGNLGDIGPIMYPAAYRDVCGVAAIANDGTRWPDSQRGTHCDLSAPGVAIESAGLGGGFESRSGTSNSTAIVSGVAALVLSACLENGTPLPSGTRLGSILTGTARRLWDSAAARTIEFGFGCVDPVAAIHTAI